MIRLPISRKYPAFNTRQLERGDPTKSPEGREKPLAFLVKKKKPGTPNCATVKKSLTPWKGGQIWEGKATRGQKKKVRTDRNFFGNFRGQGRGQGGEMEGPVVFITKGTFSNSNAPQSKRGDPFGWSKKSKESSGGRRKKRSRFHSQKRGSVPL